MRTDLIKVRSHAAPARPPRQRAGTSAPARTSRTGSAIAFFDRQEPVPPARRRLQAKLDEVIAEQDDRVRLARA
jgi:hypothetical protein